MQKLSAKTGLAVVPGTSSWGVVSLGPAGSSQAKLDARIFPMRSSRGAEGYRDLLLT